MRQDNHTNSRPEPSTRKGSGPAAREPNEWFVLAKLNETVARPSFYIAPRNVIAGATYAQHQEFLQRPRTARKTVKDTARRSLLVKEPAGYEDKWDLLERPANEAPLLIGE